MKKKIKVIVAIAILLLMIVSMDYAFRIFARKVLANEYRHSRDVAKREMELLKEQMRILAVNLAQWDETCLFVENPLQNKHYFEKNIPALVFENFNCNAILLFDSANKLVDYRYFDKANRQFSQFAFIEDGYYLRYFEPFFEFSNVNDSRFGVIPYEKEYLITIAVPITNSEVNKGQRGTLFFITTKKTPTGYDYQSERPENLFIEGNQVDTIIADLTKGWPSFVSLTGSAGLIAPVLQVNSLEGLPDVFVLLHKQTLLYGMLHNFRLHLVLSLFFLVLLTVVGFAFWGNRISPVMKSTAKPSKIFIVIFGLSGFILIGITSFTIRNALVEERMVAMDRISKQFVHEFQNRFADFESKLDNLYHFFLSSDTVTRSEFSLFTESILRRSPEVKFIAWIPAVNPCQALDIEKRLKQEGFLTNVSKIFHTDDKNEIANRYVYIEPLATNKDFVYQEFKHFGMSSASLTGDGQPKLFLSAVSASKSEIDLVLPLVQKGEEQDSNSLKQQGYLVARVDLEILVQKINEDDDDFHLLQIALSMPENDGERKVAGIPNARHGFYSQINRVKQYNKVFDVNTDPNPLFFEKFSDSRFWISLIVGILSILMLSGIIYYRERNIMDIYDAVVEKTAKPLMARAQFRWKIILPIIVSLAAVSVVILLMARWQIFKTEKETSEHRIEFTKSVLVDKMDYYAMVLERTLLFLSYDKAIAEAWDMNDYEELYDRTYEYFQMVKEQFKITDIQFVDNENKIRLSVLGKDTTQTVLSDSFLLKFNDRKIVLDRNLNDHLCFYGMVSPNELIGRKILVSIDFNSIIIELSNLIGYDLQVFSDFHSLSLKSQSTINPQGKFDYSDFSSIKQELELSKTPVIQYSKADKEYFCNLIPFHIIGLQTDGYLLVSRDITNRVHSNKQDYSKILILVLGIILLLIIITMWVVSHAEKQLMSALQSYNAEVKLRADMERRVSATLNSIGDAVISTDVLGNIIDMNPIAEKLTGYSSEEVNGMPLESVFRIYNSKTGEKAESPVNEVIKSQKAVNLDNHIYLESKQKQKYHIADSASPIVMGDGSLAGVVLVFRDVSDEYRIREELKENELMFRTLTENSPIGVLVLLNNRWDYANEKAAAITGYSQQELSGFNFWEIVHPDFQESVRQRGLSRQKGDTLPASYEFKIITKRKKERWVHLTGANIVFKGQQAGLITMTDITEIKETQFEIELLKTAIENATNEVYIFSTDDLRFLYTNRAACKNLGFTALQMESMTPFDIIVNYSPNELKALMDSTKKLKLSVIKSEKMHRRRDGSVYPVESSLAHFTADDKGYFVEIVTDISARKKAETQLAESERRYRMLFHDSYSVMLLVDPATDTIVDANQAACDYYGYDHASIRKLKYGQFIADNHERFDLVNDVNNAGENREAYTTRHVLSNGQVRHVEVNMSIIQLEGNILEYLIINDITDKKMAEKELIKAKEKAEESDKLKSAFLANMSHEIRTPLNGVIGFAKLLLKEKLETDKRLKYSQVIVRSSNQLLRIVNDILDISRIETGQIVIRNSIFDLQELLQDVVILFAESAREKGIEIKLEPLESHQNRRVAGDIDKLRQVITNLVHNAIKFTLKGEVAVRYYVTPDKFVVVVEDTGIGISKEAQGYIFENFRQASDDIAPKFGGTGLGLAICKGYVQSMNGRIWVESEQGCGSRFHVEILKV